MIYGKLINDELVIYNRQDPIIIGNVSYFTSDPDLMLQCGWKPVVYTDPDPQDGHTASGHTWVEDDTTIVQDWQYTLIEEEPVSDEERISALELAVIELARLVTGV